MKKSSKNQKGLSLIEVIVSMALLGMILAAIMSFGQFHYRSYHEIEDAIDMQSTIRHAMNSITTQLAHATELYNHPTNPTYRNGQSQEHIIQSIVFVLGSNEGNRYYILEQKEDTLYYAVTSSSSTLEEAGRTLLVSGIEYVKIQVDADYHLVDLVLKAATEKDSLMVEEKVFMRNHR